ncbi:hypothetical protein HY256_11470 [Candidatus Sumerlaeota bacterium]|nr:hypothetical protein [Candidatus Sumerlaeota bacterium]
MTRLKVDEAAPAIKTAEGTRAAEFPVRPKGDDSLLSGSLRPPLSLADAIASLTECANSLRGFSGRLRDEDAETMIKRLTAVISYIRMVDDTNPTLPYYQWHFVDRGKAKDGRDDLDVFTPARPIPGVTAVAFRVAHGDIRVQTVRVSDPSGLTFEFNMNKDIPADMPRREVCLLEKEIDLAKIEIVYRGLTRQEAKAPRVTIEAGISSVPEYGREAIYNLSLARRGLQDRNAAETEKRLRDALKSLAAYCASRKL